MSRRPTDRSAGFESKVFEMMVRRFSSRLRFSPAEKVRWFARTEPRCAPPANNQRAEPEVETAEDLERTAVWSELVTRRVVIDGLSRYYRMISDITTSLAWIAGVATFGSSLATVGTLLSSASSTITTGFAAAVAIAQMVRFGVGHTTSQLVSVRIAWGERAEAYADAIFRIKSGKVVSVGEVARLRRDDQRVNRESARIIYIPWLVGRAQKRAIELYASDFEGGSL